MQKAIYTLTDSAGNVLSGATVSVYAAGTNNLVSIRSSNDGPAMPNPFTASAQGRVEFYAANGRYRIVASVPDGRSVILEDVLIADFIQQSNQFPDRGDHQFSGNWDLVTADGSYRVIPGAGSIGNGAPPGAYNFGILQIFQSVGTIAQVYIPDQNPDGPIYVRTRFTGNPFPASWRKFVNV